MVVKLLRVCAKRLGIACLQELQDCFNTGIAGIKLSSCRKLFAKAALFYPFKKTMVVKLLRVCAKRLGIACCQELQDCFNTGIAGIKLSSCRKLFAKAALFYPFKKTMVVKLLRVCAKRLGIACCQELQDCFNTGIAGIRHQRHHIDIVIVAFFG